jgi:hypothetical protein
MEKIVEKAGQIVFARIMRNDDGPVRPPGTVAEALNDPTAILPEDFQLESPVDIEHHCGHPVVLFPKYTPGTGSGQS